MAVRTIDELLESVKILVGDDTSDTTITIIEDVSDTLTDYENRLAGDGEDWKAKFEENDRAWRERYKERFFDTPVKEVIEEKEDEKEEPLTFDGLFKEE